MCWKIQVLKTNWFILQVTSVTEGNVTEKLSGTTPLLISRLKQTLAKLFYNYWTDIFHPIIDYIRLSIGTLRKLVIYVCLTWHHTFLLRIIQESKKSQHLNPKTCDFQVAENCPLNGNCKQSAVIYQADITQEIDNEHTYIGLTEGSFKERLSDHHTSFKYEQYKYKSKLSSFIWEMENKGQN